MLWDNISRIFAILAFLFLKTYDGIKNTIYIIFRNFIAQKFDKSKKKFLILIIMIFILMAMYIFNFNNLATICIAIFGIINLYGTFNNEQDIRVYGMIGSIFYALFMILSKNTTGFICEIICFFMLLISFIKYRKNC